MMHSNARMREMRTTVQLSDHVYTLLRARAAERGMRGFSAIVEEALIGYLEGAAGTGEALADAEGAWSAEEIEEWEVERREAWASWSDGPSSTPTS